MWKDCVKIRGHVRVIDNHTGIILREADNIVVNVGISHIMALLSGGSETMMTYVAVGSGSTSPTTGDTALEAQIGARASATRSSPTAYTIQWQATFGAGVCTGNWYEAGVFNASSSGKMLCRVTYGLLTKGVNDSFTLQYQVTGADDGV